MKPNARRQSRSLAVQGIYSWHVSQNPIAEIEQQLLLETNVKHIDVGYFQDLLRGVVKNHAVLDEAVKPYLDRPFDEIDFVEKAILRVSAYELKYRICDAEGKRRTVREKGRGIYSASGQVLGVQGVVFESDSQ